MNRSKKIFVVVAILFILATLVVGYDITTKTSFPGSKKLLKESIAPTEPEFSDTLKLDSLKQK
jgi:ABC-type cobalt transport system substrate-binding protein